MSCDARNPVIGVSDQIRQKPAYTATEGWKLKIFEFNKKRDGNIHEANTKALISFAVIAQLICVFIFAHVKNTFLMWIYIAMELPQKKQSNIYYSDI